MKTIKREYSLLFVFFVLIISFGIFLGISIIGLTGGTKTLEQIYIIFFVILAIVLLTLISAIIIFLLITLKVQAIKRQDVLNITTDEIVRMKDNEKEEFLRELKSKKKRVQYLIDFTKAKYYQRELDEESFKEIIRDHQKNLIEIELKIKEMKDEMKKLSKRRKKK